MGGGNKPLLSGKIISTSYLRAYQGVLQLFHVVLISLGYLYCSACTGPTLNTCIFGTYSTGWLPASGVGEVDGWSG